MIERLNERRKTPLDIICALVFASLVAGVLSNPAAAGDYFKPYSEDGGAVTLDPCGQNPGRSWVRRSLGGGLVVEASLSPDGGKSISATLLFRSGDPGLRLVPAGIRLHVFPGGRVFAPSAIRRAAYRATSETCPQHGERLHLTFPVQPGVVEQAALVFADDSVAERVRPFRFERTDDAAAEGPAPVRPPISIEALLPSKRPRDPLAQVPPHLKGVWAIDAKRTEERMKKAGPPNVPEPGFVAGLVGFWFLGVLTFDDNSLTVGAYRGARTFRYRHVSNQGGKIEYVREDPSGSDEEEVLTVTFLGDRNIHLQSTRPNFIEYCAWQRSHPMNESQQFEAGKRALEAFKATMQNVEQAWFPKPGAPTPKGLRP